MPFQDFFDMISGWLSEIFEDFIDAIRSGYSFQELTEIMFYDFSEFFSDLIAGFRGELG